MNKIITVIDKEPRVGSKMLADGFEVQHQAAQKLIQKYMDDFKEFGEVVEVSARSNVGSRISNTKTSPKKDTGGAPTTEYFLNEQQAAFFGTLTRNSLTSVQFKKRLVKEFYSMRRQLDALKSHQSTDQWQAARLEGKAHRRSETDAIKAFVEYAQKQGSGSADRYYEALTKMENAALFVVAGKYPNLRNIMSSAQLFQIGCADQIIVKALKSGMEQGMPYKDIFQVAKAEVMKFGAIMGQSEIISKQLEDLT